MQIKIEKMVYGGAGLARTDQGVVFVPRTAPGDVVDVEIVERKTDYSTARMVRLVEPSPDRQATTCPNYETAGCCHWQHIRYDRQVAIKETVLRETLQRTGRITWDRPIRVIQGPERNYRLRATFHVQDRRVGFMRERSRTIVPIQECSALVPELNAFIPEANRMLAYPEMGSVREIHAVAGSTVSSTLAASPDIPRIEVNGFTFELRPETFFQTNRFLLDEFMNEVLNQSGTDTAHVLDLFCGSGFFAIPLARRSTEVLGVESNRGAIRQGRANARLNDVGNVEFFEGEVDATLRESRVRPNLVVLNPPRVGCGKKGAEQIAKLRARRVVYVSCNPSTFAREAAVFIANGYALDQVTMIDQFPDTYHIELVAQFSLG